MGYARALLAKDTAEEKRELEQAAKKKGLWGSIGGTLLGGIATVATGGLASPLVAGLAAAGGSAAGKFIGQKAAGPLPKGDFYQASRQDLGNMFKQDILGSALTAGVTAGLGQSLQLAKAGQVGKGMDFSGSILGKGIDKMKTASALTAGGMDKGLSKTLAGSKLAGSSFDLDMVKGAMGQGSGGLQGNLLSQVGQNPYEGLGMSKLAYNRMMSTGLENIGLYEEEQQY